MMLSMDIFVWRWPLSNWHTHCAIMSCEGKFGLLRISLGKFPHVQYKIHTLAQTVHPRMLCQWTYHCLGTHEWYWSSHVKSAVHLPEIYCSGLLNHAQYVLTRSTELPRFQVTGKLAFTVRHPIPILVLIHGLGMCPRAESVENNQPRSQATQNMKCTRVGWCLFSRDYDDVIEI